MSRVDENAELGRVIAEGAESGLMSNKLAELLYIQDMCKSLAVIADHIQLTRQKGKWIVSYPDGAKSVKCSICNKYNQGDVETYFCSNCGARMEVEE